jgi:hypothetical protein
MPIYSKGPYEYIEDEYIRTIYNIRWHEFDNRTKKAMHYNYIASHNNHCLALRIKNEVT